MQNNIHNSSLMPFLTAAFSLIYFCLIKFQQSTSFWTWTKEKYPRDYSNPKSFSESHLWHRTISRNWAEKANYSILLLIRYGTKIILPSLKDNLNTKQVFTLSLLKQYYSDIFKLIGVIPIFTVCDIKVFSTFFSLTESCFIDNSNICEYIIYNF